MTGEGAGGGDQTGRGGEGVGGPGVRGQEDAPSSTPGLDLMAGLSGRPREDLTRDPRALAAGVRALGDALVAILAGLSCADPAVRAAAEARRVEVLGSVRAAPPAGPRLRATVNEELDEALRRLREDPPPPPSPSPPLR